MEFWNDGVLKEDVASASRLVVEANVSLPGWDELGSSAWHSLALNGELPRIPLPTFVQDQFVELRVHEPP
jgi:hypothetical protein